MTEVHEDRRPTALLVDDDGIPRMDVADILEQAGFRTLEAEDGDEAMTMLEQHYLDISAAIVSAKPATAATIAPSSGSASAPSASHFTAAARPPSLEREPYHRTTNTIND